MLSLPSILSAAILIAVGVGARAAFVGMVKRYKARKILKNARNKSDNAWKLLEKQFQATQNSAEDYSRLIWRVKHRTFDRLLTLLDRIDQQSLAEDRSSIQVLAEISPQQWRQDLIPLLEAGNLANDGLKPLRFSFTANPSTFSLVGLFSLAGLGTTAGNLTLGWLSGNPPTAVSDMMGLLGMMIAPAMLAGGFFLKGEGEKALTKAYQQEARIQREIARFANYDAFLGQVQRQIADLKALVKTLNNRAFDGLDELESRLYAGRATLANDAQVFVGPVSFVVDRDSAKLQEVIRLVKALAEIISVPLLDQEGNLNEAAIDLQSRYQYLQLSQEYN